MFWNALFKLLEENYFHTFLSVIALEAIITVESIIRMPKAEMIFAVFGRGTIFNTCMQEILLHQHLLLGGPNLHLAQHLLLGDLKLHHARHLQLEDLRLHLAPHLLLGDLNLHLAPHLLLGRSLHLDQNLLGPQALVLSQLLALEVVLRGALRGAQDLPLVAKVMNNPCYICNIIAHSLFQRKLFIVLKLIWFAFSDFFMFMLFLTTKHSLN